MSSEGDSVFYCVIWGAAENSFCSLNFSSDYQTSGRLKAQGHAWAMVGIWQITIVWLNRDCLAQGGAISSVMSGVICRKQDLPDTIFFIIPLVFALPVDWLPNWLLCWTLSNGVLSLRILFAHNEVHTSLFWEILGAILMYLYKLLHSIHCTMRMSLGKAAEFTKREELNISPKW